MILSLTQSDRELLIELIEKESRMTDLPSYKTQLTKLKNHLVVG